MSSKETGEKITQLKNELSKLREQYHRELNEEHNCKGPKYFLIPESIVLDGDTDEYIDKIVMFDKYEIHEDGSYYDVEYEGYNTIVEKSSVFDNEEDAIKEVIRRTNYIINEHKTFIQYLTDYINTLEGKKGCNLK